MQAINNISIDYPSVLASVVVPVYNSELYLRECLDSVLAQGHSNFELICVDDGSTDSSADILREYAAKDNRITIITQENQGPGIARNNGLERASGEYVYFLDSDDFIDPELLACCVTALEQSGDDIVAFGYNEYNMETGSTRLSQWSGFLTDLPAAGGTWRDDPDNLFLAYQNLPWNKFFRTSFLRENDIKFQDIWLTEDLMFAAPALIQARGITVLDKAFVTQRQGTSSNAMSNKDLHPLDFLKAFEALLTYLKDNNLYDGLRRAFLNWACEGCMYNLLTLNSYQGFQRAYMELANGGLESLGLADASPEDFFEAYRESFLHFIEMIKKNDVNNYLMDAYVGMRNGCDIREIHIQNLLTDLNIQKSDNAHLQEVIESRDRQIEGIESQLEETEGKLNELYDSTTWKIGTVVTAVPRAVKDRLAD